MNQDFINRPDWDECELLYRKALEEIANTKWIKVALFEEDIAVFFQSFRLDIKPAFEKAFSAAQKNDAVRAMHYNFEHGGDYGGDSRLNLCDQFNIDVSTAASTERPRLFMDTCINRNNYGILQ